MAGPSHAEGGDRAPIRIMASLNPLALLLREALGEAVEVEVLLPPNRSPHLYQLSPNDLRRIVQSDWLVWVGPSLEGFLPKVLRQAPNTRTISLLEELYSQKPGELLAFGGKPLVAGQPASAVNPHVWLSRNLAHDIASAVATQLVEQHPEWRTEIESQLTQFRTRMSLLPTIAEPSSVKLVSYHNAFHYLAKDLNQTIEDVVIEQSALTPGLRHLGSLMERFEQGGYCLILEPQFAQSRLLQKLSAAADHSVLVDPLGAGMDSYSAAYNRWVEKLRECGEAATSSPR